MTLIYPVEERARARGAVRRLHALGAEAKRASESGLLLPEATRRGIIQLTQTEDKSRQVDALTALATELEKRHLDKLLPLAHDEFNAFCEYVNPGEPPESKWHIWLTNKLQEIEYNPSLDRFILNCPPGHAKPLGVDTLILMGNGNWRRLGDIRPGERAISHHGRVCRVTAVHEQGVLPQLRIETEAGRVIFSAPDHPFLTGVERWTNAAELRPGDPLMVVGARRLTAGRPNDLSHQPDQMFPFAALWLVHGIAGQMWRIKAEHEDRHAHLMQLARDAGLSPSPFTGGYKFTVADTRRLKRLFGTKGQSDRRIPSWLFRASDSKIRLFLNQVIALKGLARGPKLKLTVRSEPLARDLQRLFARFGLEAELRLPDHDGAGTVLWLRTVPTQKALEPGARRPVLSAFNDRVASVMPAEPAACRCLTIEGDHSFLADGVAVHNSTYASRLFVAWRMGRNPNLKIIGGGHSQRFVENEFSAKIRNLVASPDYKRVFPQVVIDYATRAKDQWALAGTTGQYAAKGVGQAVHGFRANFVCVDDPYAKIEEAESPVQRAKVETWFTGDLGSRMLPYGKMFLIMTRFHEEDLTGYLMAMNPTLPAYAQWHQVEAPALCIDPETDILHRQLGEVLWDYYDLSYFVTKKTEWKYQRFALVYQQIADATSTESVAGKFQFYQRLPHMEPDALRAAKAEGLVDEQGRVQAQPPRLLPPHHPQRRHRRQGDPTGRLHRHPDLGRDPRPALLPDAPDPRQARLQQDDRGDREAGDRRRGRRHPGRRQGPGHRLHPGARPDRAPAPARPGADRAIDPQGQSKSFRFDEVSPMIEAGEVYLPQNAQWLDALVKEVGQFPEGAHDDQVDALSQALRYFKTTRSRYGSRRVKSYG
jgi:hypothetical protein